MAQLPTVHLFPPTTCSRRVLMCLAELGCKEGSEFAINLVSTTGPNKSAAHMRLQPFGKIKHQRTKDTSNARITVAKIRQSKTAGPALDPADRADDDKSNETVAEPAE